MGTKVSSYPLTWPPGWPRTAPAGRKAGPFKTTIAGALKNVETEIKRIGGKITVISSNVSLGESRPSDPGIAVYFDYDGESTAIPCDRWTSVEANLQAVARTIEAMRGIERWGAKHMIKSAFRGWAQLAGPEGAPEHWTDVLDIAAHASTEAVRARYQQVRSNAHPDKGGTADAFARVERAWKNFREERGLAK